MVSTVVRRALVPTCYIEVLVMLKYGIRSFTCLVKVNIQNIILTLVLFFPHFTVIQWTTIMQL